MRRRTTDPLYGESVYRFHTATGFETAAIKHYVDDALNRDQEEFVRRFILWFQGIEPKNQSLETAVVVHEAGGWLQLNRDGWYFLEEVA